MCVCVCVCVCVCKTTFISKAMFETDVGISDKIVRMMIEV